MPRKPNPKRKLIEEIKAVYREHGRRRQAKMDAYSVEELAAHLANIGSPEWDWKLMGVRENIWAKNDPSRTFTLPSEGTLPPPDLKQWAIGPGTYNFTVPPGYRAELTIRKESVR